MRTTKKSAAIVGLLASFTLVAAACGSDEKPTTAATEAKPASNRRGTCSNRRSTDGGGPCRATDAAPAATDVASEDVCPAKIVIQTDWWPELEHGGTYQLIGPAGKIDKANFNYSGPIQEQYAAGGVKEVEIRAGGDAISFASVASEMYTDTDITFGYVNSSTQ